MYLLANRDKSPLYLFDGYDSPAPTLGTSLRRSSSSTACLQSFPMIISPIWAPRDPNTAGYWWGLRDLVPCCISTPMRRALGTPCLSVENCGSCFLPTRIRPLWLVTSSNYSGKYLQFAGSVYDYFTQAVPDVISKTKHYLYFVQQPNETVYIPNGWWHAVLNLEHTIAITQNYVGRCNFSSFWKAFNKESPGLAKQFYSSVKA